ncbi:hypothetical protein JJL56_28225 [Azospirillum sp. YIM DDC1]|uniref:Uncharacterized protein n=1 Tax=Azospirillum aestuarii TaxID=2802052 RepID=A0ABS1I6Q8_9PROT|nr:hypothetical protein [Azospirillum aestuarii]MBK4722748.1 hypothetical protein [Azospirillum aestuarii]
MLTRQRRQAGRDGSAASAQNLNPRRHPRKDPGNDQRPDARFEVLDEKELGGRPFLQTGLRFPLHRQFAGKAIPKDLTIPTAEPGEVLGSDAEFNQETVGQVVRQKIKRAAEQLEIAQRPLVDPDD